MIYYLLAISILSLLLVCFFYLKKVRVSKEVDYFIVFFPTILSLFVIIYKFSIVEPLDIRYVDKRVRELKHYCSWVEKIQRTDSVTGKRRIIKVTHGEFYSFTYLNDEGIKVERDLPKSTFDYFSEKWSNKPSSVIRDSLGRKVITYKWNNDVGKRPILTYTLTEPFVNYFKNTIDLYNLSSVSEEYARKIGLFDRYNQTVTINSDEVPELRQSLVYGINLGDSIDRSLSYLASMSSNFRPLLLVWIKDDNYENTYLNKDIIKLQKSYWKGGKDNEVIFCICINNSSDKKILWSGSFSWAEDNEFETFILNNALCPGDTLDPKKYLDFVIEGYGKNLWKPRDFSDYYFCKMPLSNLKIVIFFLLLIIINVFISIKIVKKNGASKSLL